MLKWSYWFGRKPILFKLNKIEAIDIDEIEDFNLAKKFMNMKILITDVIKDKALIEKKILEKNIQLKFVVLRQTKTFLKNSLNEADAIFIL